MLSFHTAVVNTLKMSDLCRNMPETIVVPRICPVCRPEGSLFCVRVNGAFYFAEPGSCHFDIIALLGIMIRMIELLQML